MSGRRSLWRITLSMLFLFGTAAGAGADGGNKSSQTDKVAPANIDKLAPATTDKTIDPDELDVVNKTKDLLNKKLFARALAQLNLAIDKSPLSAQLHLWRGNVYWRVCDYRDAIKDFDTAINQNDTLADAYAHKAVCLARLGSYDAALEMFRAAAKRKATDPTVTLLVSRALFEHQDYQSALDYLKDFDDKAVNQPEILANIYLTRAQAEADLGQLDAAIEDTNKALAVNAQFYLAYVARARVYQKQEQYEKAIADVKKALELNQLKFPVAHLIAGECFLSLGKLEDADKEIAMAIKDSGRIPSGEAQHYKALITERKGNFLGSLPDRVVAMQLGYSDPPALTIVGREVLSVDKIFNTFPSIIVTDHFISYSDLSKEQLERYSRIVEGFANYTNTNVASLQGEYPALLFILHDKPTSEHFLKDRMDSVQHVHGVFISNKNSVVTYEGAGMGTLLHEVMHKFLYNPKPHDFWADEGIPSFFEKSYGYLYKDSPEAAQNLFLKTGFADSGSQFLLWLTHHSLKLSQIVSAAHLGNHNNEDAERMVALFVNQQNKLKPFLDLTYKGQRGKYKYYIEAAFDKTLEELDPLFDTFVAQVNKDHDAISKLPETQIFDSQEGFDRFIKEHPVLATLRE